MGPRDDEPSRGGGAARRAHHLHDRSSGGRGNQETTTAPVPDNQVPSKKVALRTKNAAVLREAEENPELLARQQIEFAASRPTGRKGYVEARSGANRDRRLTVVYFQGSPGDAQQLRREVKVLEDFVTAWNNGEQSVNGKDTYWNCQTIACVLVISGPHKSAFSLLEPRHMTVQVATEEQIRAKEMRTCVHVYVGDSQTRPAYQGWHADYNHPTSAKRTKGGFEEAMARNLLLPLPLPDSDKSGSGDDDKKGKAPAAAATTDKESTTTHEHHHHRHHQHQHNHEEHRPGDGEDVEPKAPRRRSGHVDSERAAKLARVKVAVPLSAGAPQKQQQQQQQQPPSSSTGQRDPELAAKLAKVKIAVPLSAAAAAAAGGEKAPAGGAAALGYLVKDDTKFYWSESKKRHFFHDKDSGEKSFFDFPAVSKSTKIARTLDKMPIYITEDGKFFYKDKATNSSHWLKNMKQGAPGS